MFSLTPPTEKYVYNILQIQSEHGIDFSNRFTRSYSVPNMIEYIMHGTSALDYINRIYYCEHTPKLTDTDREELRERISFIYNYHSKVHNDKNFDPKLLKICFPEYTSHVDKCPNINIPYERFKHHQSISPLFNGSGCAIL